MNKEYILFHLKEVQEDLSEVIENLNASNDYSEIEFGIDIQHIYHHLNTAWNSRFSELKDIEECTEENFEIWRQFPTDIEMKI